LDDVMTASLIKKVVPSEEELLALLKKVRQENPQYSLCRVYIEVKSRKRDWSIGETQVEQVMKKYNMLQQRKTKIPEIPFIDKDHYIAYFTDDKEEVPIIKDTGKTEIPSFTKTPPPKKDSSPKKPNTSQPTPKVETSKVTEKHTTKPTNKTKKSEPKEKDAKDNKPPDNDPFPFVRLVAAKVQLEEQMRIQEDILRQNPNNNHTPLFTADEIEQTFTISNMPEKARQEFEKAKKQYKDMNLEGASVFAENITASDDEKIKEHLNGLDDLSNPEQMNEFLKRTMFDTVTSLGFPVIHRRKDGSVHFIPGKTTV